MPSNGLQITRKKSVKNWASSDRQDFIILRRDLFHSGRAPHVRRRSGNCAILRWVLFGGVGL